MQNTTKAGRPSKTNASGSEKCGFMSERKGNAAGLSGLKSTTRKPRPQPCQR